MEEINVIYYNSFGIAFQWKRSVVKDFKKIQFVFRNTGLYLTHDEIKRFSKNINRSLNSASSCINCSANRSCRSLLLEAPNSQINFAMSYEELTNVEDLVSGCLFNLNFDDTIKRILAK